MKKHMLLLTLVLIGVLIMAPASWGASSSEYVIGFAGPLTGASAQDGESARRGVEIAVKQVNAEGGIDGKTVRISVQDDKTDPKEAAIVANKLVQDQSIVAVVGHFNSSCTLAGAPIYGNGSLPHIAFGSSSPAVSQTGPFTFRTIPTDDVGGRFSAQWAFNEYDVKKAAIMYENTDYGLGVLSVFEDECAKNGIEIVAKESYLIGETTDFTTSITRIRSLAPDLLFLGSLYNEAALIAKQSAILGLDVPMASVDGLYSHALIELGGPDVEGITFAAFFSDSNPDPLVQDFVAAYQADYGSVPSTYAAYAFDATLVILDALKNAGGDRRKIQEHISNIDGIPGVTGLNAFDENGDVSKSPVFVTIKDGVFTVIQ